MTAITPANSFSVGKDLAVILVGPTGVVQLPKITGWHFEPQYDSFSSKPLDGPTRKLDLPDGHNFSIKYDREDATVDNFFALIEAAYWAAGGFVPTFTMYAYITERSGGQTTFEFVEATVKYKQGEWKTGAAVSGQIDGYARYWRVV
jgi:hypothetical protein